MSTMTDTNDDTASATGDAPAPETPPAAAAAPTADELASLRSRNSGLNAKVTELTKRLETLTEELGTARKGLTDKDSADADLKRQLAEAQANIEKLTRANETATLAAQYPAAFEELGEGIYGMAPERLASLNARLAGVKDPGGEQPETPRPVGNNPQRQQGGSKNIEDMTSEELRESLRNMPREAFGLGDSS